MAEPRPAAESGHGGVLSPALVRRFVREARRRRSAMARGQTLEPLTLQQLLALHGQATMAVLLILLALITTVPVAGAGMLFSLGILAWAWRWARGEEAPTLEGLRRLRLSPAAALRCLRWLACIYAWALGRLGPCWPALQHPGLRWLWAGWVALMAAIIFLPIPLGNLCPAAALLFFGLGLLTQDGRMLAASLALGLAGLLVLVWVGGWAWQALSGLLPTIASP